jgi:hypothetical protein
LLDGGIAGIADSSIMYVTVQTVFGLAANLFSLNLKEVHEHEYEFECRCRTFAGACDRDINFAGAEVFKLFRGRVFDRRGHLGANAP